MQYVVRLVSAAILSFLLIGSAVAANGDGYAGFAYHSGTLAFSGGTEYKPKGLDFKVGKYISDTVAIEGRFLLGAGGDTKTFYDSFWGYIDSEIRVTSGYALAVRGNLPLSQTASFYAVVGFGSLELEQTIAGFGSTTNSESGVVYGFGAEGSFGNDLGIYAEYMVYPGSPGDIDTTQYDYTGLNIGISKKF